MSKTARKHSRFVTCTRHKWLDGERRSRRAEFFVEGGPAGQEGCEGGTCRLFPGTDLFIEEICHGELTLDWTVKS